MRMPVDAKKPVAKKAAKSKRGISKLAVRKLSPRVKFLPLGAIRLTESDYAMQALSTDCSGPNDL